MIAEEIDQIVGVQGPLSLQEELQLEDKRLQDFIDQHFRKQAVNQEEKIVRLCHNSCFVYFFAS